MEEGSRKGRKERTEVKCSDTDANPLVYFVGDVQSGCDNYSTGSFNVIDSINLTYKIVQKRVALMVEC